MSGERPPSTPLRNIRRERLVDPPARERIDALPALGGESVSFDLSGISVTVEGLDAPLAREISARFGAYLIRGAAPREALRIRAHADAIDYYVQPDTGETAEGYYRLGIVHEAGLIRLVAYGMAAWLDLSAPRGAIAFGTGAFDPRERAFENLVRVAVAWMAVRRGGFLIHGASIARGGRGYVFFGKSASGKSTLASLSPEGRVISDDLSLVLRGPAGPVVAGTPFRGSYRLGDPVVGTYPLAAMYRIVKDGRTFVEKPSPLFAFAEYVANLPFVNDALHEYNDLMDQIENAVRDIPIRVLHFTKAPDFWPVIDASLK